jgi:hypothetical protein
MLFSITERGHGRELMERLKRHNVFFHVQFVGAGTASSEMMDLLGLGTNDKDVIVSFATQSAAQALVHDLSNSLEKTHKGKGILMLLTPNAISNLLATVIARQNEEMDAKGVEEMAKSEYQYSLICIAVNRGYADAVMQTARRAGATGGTVIRARLAGVEKTEQYFGELLDEEREIIAIMTSDANRNQIMDEVNATYGLRTAAQGIICALPVDRALKL